MEKIRRKDIVTALTVYSSRVSAGIGILDEDGAPNIAGLGKSEGRLLGAKGVLDIDALSRAIRDSLKTAQEEAGVESSRAFVGISGGSIKSERSRGIVKLSQRGYEISDKNVREVLKVANTIPINMAREIMHSIPQDFIVDGQNDIRNPVGLHGAKLETETLLITAHIPFSQNIIKALNLAGIDVEDIVFSGIAAGRCLLSGDAGDKGAVLMEIDNNFTAISVFFDNVLRGIDIQQKSVIEEGVLEALKENADKIRAGKPVSKIILAGGGYIHEDFIEKVESVFGVPSQMAYARNAKGRARDITSPSHITSIGLILYGFGQKGDRAADKRGGLGILRSATRRMGEFLEEYF